MDLLMEQLFKTKYRLKKANTKNRIDLNGNQIEFLLTFSEYCKLWEDKGLIPVHPWCISRINDLGNYEIGNIFISTVRRNALESIYPVLDEHLLTDFALLYKMKRSQVRRSLNNGTLTLDFINKYMQGKSVLGTNYE